MAKYRMIDLFAGCGGITQGFVETGLFHPVAAVELDHQASATYAQNFGDHVSVGDIGEWVSGSMPKADVIVGGPPCQGYSALGKQDPMDPRNTMWRYYAEAIHRVRPAFFVLENVPQFLKSKEFAGLSDETRRGGLLAHYQLEPFVLNAASYGVAQNRRRAVVIGRRNELRPIGPPAEVNGRMSLRDAFSTELKSHVTETDLPPNTIEFRRRTIPGAFKMREIHITRRSNEVSLARYRAIPPKGSRRDLPDHLLLPCWRRHTIGGGDVMGRLDWSRPSVTIRTEFFKPEKGRFLHPDEHRPITHAEAAAIQGFPETFLWCGNASAIARQIGNAVPPPLARAVASHLAAHLH